MTFFYFKGLNSSSVIYVCEVIKDADDIDKNRLTSCSSKVRKINFVSPLLIIGHV